MLDTGNMTDSTFLYRLTHQVGALLNLQKTRLLVIFYEMKEQIGLNGVPSLYMYYYQIII